jgi:kynurenine formamidase
MKIIDLSILVTDLPPAFPGDEQLRLIKDRALQTDGFNNFHMSTGMHSGSHIDGPMHMLDTDVTIGSLPPERFIGKGVVLNVTGQENILFKTEYRELIPENSIVLFYTGFGKIYGSDSYYSEHPAIDEKLAEFLAGRKIKMIGIDAPTIDYEPYPAHKILLSAGVLIAENLTNLDSLLEVPHFEITALPLRLTSDSSPARIIARIPD